MTSETSDPPRKDFAPALLVVQMLVAAGSSVYIWFQRMGIAGCAQECDFALVTVAADVFFALALILTVATGALLLWLPQRRSRDASYAWLPLLGIALTLILAFVASSLVNAAINPPVV